jgi:hypothetical protein
MSMEAFISTTIFLPSPLEPFPHLREEGAGGEVELTGVRVKKTPYMQPKLTYYA